jgi:hypothetical protein
MYIIKKEIWMFDKNADQLASLSWARGPGLGSRAWVGLASLGWARGPGLGSRAWIGLGWARAKPSLIGQGLAWAKLKI